MLNNYTTPVQVAMDRRDEVTELMEVAFGAKLERSLSNFPSLDNLISNCNLSSHTCIYNPHTSTRKADTKVKLRGQK